MMWFWGQKWSSKCIFHTNYYYACINAHLTDKAIRSGFELSECLLVSSTYCDIILLWSSAGGIRTCSSLEFQCDDGRCISSVFKCDGQSNCADGSDERTCEPGFCVVLKTCILTTLYDFMTLGDLKK